MNGTDKRGASCILPSMQPESSLGNGCAITATKLSKCMRGTSVLDNITLEIPPGRTVGLAGANGSGKTMLMRALLGLIKPTSGTVALDGKTLWKDLSFPPQRGRAPRRSRISCASNRSRKPRHARVGAGQDRPRCMRGGHSRRRPQPTRPAPLSQILVGHEAATRYCRRYHGTPKAHRSR